MLSMFKAVLIVFPVEAAKVKTLSRFFALFCIFYGQSVSISLREIRPNGTMSIPPEIEHRHRSF